MSLTLEQKRIWYDWRRMHFRVATLIENLENAEYHSHTSVAIQRELDELNRQMAELEDENDPWLAELITNEF
jgi:hypothetical protein